MEEAAMRKVTKYSTQEQIECIPREEGESWIGLYNIPPKIRYWRQLNLCKATGDREFLMDYMDTADLGLGRLTMFDFAKYDVYDVLTRLNYDHGLLCLTMEKDEDSDKDNPGLSSGHDWQRTRESLMKEKMTRDFLEVFESRGVRIHNGVVSYKYFDWTFTNGEWEGEHCFIIAIYSGKKMRFTDGNRECTLTLPHGAYMTLSTQSKFAEKLVDKESPPYILQGPQNDVGSLIPKTDNMEPDAMSEVVYFIMLDVTVRCRGDDGSHGSQHALLSRGRSY